MAGFTDSAFRQIVKEIEPNAICFSELTSINGLMHASEKTFKMLKFSKKERPIILQLFGNSPEFFAKAGKILEKSGADGIDINMGCPAPKVTKSEYGSALFNNPILAGKIVKALKKSVKIPVSVKIRIGYAKYYEEDFLKFIKVLEKSGADLLTIHGRTTKQGYGGEANFEPIYLAKKHLKIPVIGNGDITSAEKAATLIKSPDGKITLDGLMIGRATMGNPWIVKEIYKKLHGKKGLSKPKTLKSNPAKTTPSKKSTTPVNPPKSFKQKLPTIKKHLKLSLKLHGNKVGLFEMKKHLGSYIAGFPNASKYRTTLLTAKTPKETIEILESIPFE